MTESADRKALRRLVAHDQANDLREDLPPCAELMEAELALAKPDPCEKLAEALRFLVLQTSKHYEFKGHPMYVALIEARAALAAYEGSKS